MGLAPPPPPADQATQRFEDRFVLLQAFLHVFGGQPPVWVKTLGLGVQPLTPFEVGDAPGDGSHHVGVPVAKAGQRVRAELAVGSASGGFFDFSPTGRRRGDLGEWLLLRARRREARRSLLLAPEDLLPVELDVGMMLLDEVDRLLIQRGAPDPYARWRAEPVEDSLRSAAPAA